MDKTSKQNKTTGVSPKIRSIVHKIVDLVIDVIDIAMARRPAKKPDVPQSEVINLDD